MTTPPVVIDLPELLRQARDNITHARMQQQLETLGLAQDQVVWTLEQVPLVVLTKFTYLPHPKSYIQLSKIIVRLECQQRLRWSGRLDKIATLPRVPLPVQHHLVQTLTCVTPSQWLNFIESSIPCSKWKFMIDFIMHELLCFPQRLDFVTESRLEQDQRPLVDEKKTAVETTLSSLVLSAYWSSPECVAQLFNLWSSVVSQNPLMNHPFEVVSQLFYRFWTQVQTWQDIFHGFVSAFPASTAQDEIIHHMFQYWIMPQFKRLVSHSCGRFSNQRQEEMAEWMERLWSLSMNNDPAEVIIQDPAIGRVLHRVRRFIAVWKRTMLRSTQRIKISEPLGLPQVWLCDPKALEKVYILAIQSNLSIQEKDIHIETLRVLQISTPTIVVSSPLWNLPCSPREIVRMRKRIRALHHGLGSSIVDWSWLDQVQQYQSQVLALLHHYVGLKSKCVDPGQYQLRTHECSPWQRFCAFSHQLDKQKNQRVDTAEPEQRMEEEPMVHLKDEISVIQDVEEVQTKTEKKSKNMTDVLRQLIEVYSEKDQRVDTTKSEQMMEEEPVVHSQDEMSVIQEVEEVQSTAKKTPKNIRQLIEVYSQQQRVDTTQPEQMMEEEPVVHSQDEMSAKQDEEKGTLKTDSQQQRVDTTQPEQMMEEEPVVHSQDEISAKQKVEEVNPKTKVKRFKSLVKLQIHLRRKSSMLRGK